MVSVLAEKVHGMAISPRRRGQKRKVIGQLAKANVPAKKEIVEPAKANVPAMKVIVRCAKVREVSGIVAGKRRHRQNRVPLQHPFLWS
jgi:hypothetical protein